MKNTEVKMKINEGVAILLKLVQLALHFYMIYMSVAGNHVKDKDHLNIVLCMILSFASAVVFIFFLTMASKVHYYESKFNTIQVEIYATFFYFVFLVLGGFTLLIANSSGNEKNVRSFREPHSPKVTEVPPKSSVYDVVIYLAITGFIQVIVLISLAFYAQFVDVLQTKKTLEDNEHEIHHEVDKPLLKAFKKDSKIKCPKLKKLNDETSNYKQFTKGIESTDCSSIGNISTAVSGTSEATTVPLDDLPNISINDDTITFEIENGRTRRRERSN